MNTPETYTCYHCGRTFEKVIPDEEARAEAAALYVPVPEGEDDTMEELCHDCWLRFMEWAAGRGILKS